MLISFSGIVQEIAKSGGKMEVPCHPGLGVEPNWKVLGDPVFCYPA